MPPIPRGCLLLSFLSVALASARAQHPAPSPSPARIEASLEEAYLRADAGAIAAVAQSLDGALASDPQNPVLLYERGFAYYVAVAPLRRKNDHPGMIAQLEQGLPVLKRVRGQPWEAEATGLRGAILAQLIGLKGGMAGLTLGPKSNELLEQAAKSLPRSPRILLFRGISLYNTPAMFGGDRAAAEDLFREAVDIFSAGKESSEKAPGPHWGQASAIAWLHIAQKNRGDEPPPASPEHSTAMISTTHNSSKGYAALQPTIADLAYANRSPKEKLDLYLPAPGSGPAPLVVWIHGGGFMVGDKHSMPRKDFGPAPKPVTLMGPYQPQVPDVAALVAKGYAVVSLNYRLGENMYAAALPAVQDGKAAVRFLRANADKYHLDPGKFAVWGNSAGGYMAAMLGVTGDQPSVFDDSSLGNADISSAVQAVVVWYGAEDRLPDPRLKIAHYLLSAKSLPAFRIVNGDADPLVSPIQARRLEDALIKAGANSTLTLLPGAGHEDPVFMATQMPPTFAFLDQTFGG